MKKVLAVFLVALLAFCTFSCGKKGICDVCNNETRIKEVTYQGVTGQLCSDCYEAFKKSLRDN